MSLPKLTDPSPSSNQLREEQLRLHSQADKMLHQTKLLQILEKYGQLEPIGGSYTYGLMVYPDLDLGVINDGITTNDFAGMVAELVKNPFVRKVSTANTVDFESPRNDRPKGYWLGLEIPFGNERWGIDCWLQKQEWAAADNNPYPELLANLSEAQKDAVLAIKYQLIFRGLYGKSFYSVDVYEAVAKNGIVTIDAFLASHATGLHGRISS